VDEKENPPVFSIFLRTFWFRVGEETLNHREINMFSVRSKLYNLINYKMQYMIYSQGIKNQHTGISLPLAR
jgi:hypothetical protein